MTTEQSVQIGSVQGVFYSVNRGQGKTVALVSYYHPKKTEQMRRLIIDEEGRSRQYRSPNGRDDPVQLLYSFDYFHEQYAEHMDDGELSVRALIQLYKDIRDRQFPFDCLLVDNAAMLQDDIRLLLLDESTAKNNAMALAKAFRGVYANHRAFLEYKFKVSDTVSIYGLVKGVIEELLRVCQRRGVDVLVATEARNVWQDYGTRDMKVLGQTAKVLEPWMKYADFVYELSRTTGSRELGTAKLIAVPYARVDTFNPKNSLPGLPPKFELTWPTFWEHVLSRKVTTEEEWADVEVAQAEVVQPEDSQGRELSEAKARLIEAALAKGIIEGKNDAKGIERLKQLLADHGLSPADALELYDACIAAIDAWKPPSSQPGRITTEVE